ncbi:MAG: alpha-ketoacid dehydrogenase subunit beta, partial [Flavobacterium sp.]
SVPIVFRGPTGNAGQLGAQHSQNFENWFANCPGLKVVVPSTPYNAKGLLKAAINDPDPVIFMESEVMYGDKGEVPEGEYSLEIGKAVVAKEGTDVTIVTFGKMLTRVVNPAVEELTKEGINVEVIDLLTVRPIDYATIIESVKKTNRMVIVEEAWPLASISSEITFNVQKHAFDHLDAPILRITCADVPLPYAPTLIAASLPNAEKVVKAVKEVMYVNK